MDVAKPIKLTAHRTLRARRTALLTVLTCCGRSNPAWCSVGNCYRVLRVALSRAN